MLIQYGVPSNVIDVTQTCMNVFKNDFVIVIPGGDNLRANFLGDPVAGKKKNIYVTLNDVVHQYDDSKTIFIDMSKNVVYDRKNVPDILLSYDVDKKLSDLHKKLILKFGTFTDEFPEQRMATQFLKGHENILEIGGNIGRNSLVISSILNSKNNSNLVVMESDTEISKQLAENRDVNGLNFHIENAALSKRNLIQKGWTTIVSNEVLPGYKKVNTITYDQLKLKYNIKFDTLVLDCEGAFSYILHDMPDIIENVNLIIMENDYNDISHKEFIDSVLTKNGFKVVYSEAGGWGPCFNNFFETWARIV